MIYFLLKKDTILRYYKTYIHFIHNLQYIKKKIKIEHVNKSNQSITSIRMDYLKTSQPKSHTILHFSILFIT